MSSIEPTSSTAPTPAYAAAGSPIGTRDALAAANARFLAAYRAGDAAVVASLYTPDAQLLPANSDVIAGTEAIAGFWSSVMSSGVADARLDTMNVDALGDLAVETGRYTMYGADGGAVDDGKYLVAWHRDGSGAWKIHRDIWTTSRPAPKGA
jgi:uncharacterized protein (TIGR02246 family)